MLVDKEKIRNLDVAFSYASQEQMIELLSKLSNNFDSYHSKMSVVKRHRALYSYFFVQNNQQDKKLKVDTSQDGISETFWTPDFNGLDISINLKTHKKQNMGRPSLKFSTIEKLNQCIEKAKKNIGLEMALILRAYFWDLITLSNESIFEVFCDNEEFIFKYEIPSSKMTIEVIVLY